MYVNQLKTSGRSRPVPTRPSGASVAGLIARARPEARTIAQPGVITRESPAIQRRSGWDGLKASLCGFGGGDVCDTRGLVAGVVLLAGGGGVNTTAVLI